MDPSTALASANQSFNGLKTLVESFVSVRDESKVGQLRIDMQKSLLDLQQKIFEAQKEAHALALTNRELEQSVMDLQHKIAERDRYGLYELRTGAFALAEKCAPNEMAKPPYFCQACHGAGTTVALQRDKTAHTDYGVWICPTNSRHNIGFGNAPPINYGRLLAR